MRLLSRYLSFNDAFGWLRLLNLPLTLYLDPCISPRKFNVFHCIPFPGMF